MKVICVLFVAFLSKGLYAQDDEDGPYRGKFLGKFNSYHHQVAGEVYAVDESTLLLVHFNYDGTGDDTFFWAGDSGRPGPQGFIVPDENGKTNILERYLDAEIRISLPEGKRISSIKWLAIYDIATQNTFADLFVPEELDAPRARTLPPLAGDPRVTSGPLRILDADTLLISGLKFPGSAATDTEAFFACGNGAQPHSRGYKLPDEYGYQEPLPAYNGTDVKLHMTGGVSLLTVEWCGIIDYRAGSALAYTALREALTVPPSTRKLLDYKTQLPNCRQLHRDMQVSWELFGEQLTFQLAGKIGDNDYMAFGISGSTTEPQMLGADVAVVSFDTHTQRVFADDYNITDKGPCISVLGAWRGVCADTQLAGLSNPQPLSGSRQDGLSILTYRTQLKPAETMDREWPTDAPVQVIWSIGALNSDRKPTFHRLYNKYPITISVSGPPTSDCTPFTTAPPQHPPRLPTPQIDPAVRTFYCTLAPPPPSYNNGPPLVWYINGHPQPTVTLTRHLHYTFYVLGGDEPHSATLYHPLTITKEEGGSQDNALVGVATSRRNRPAPTHAGPLCIGKLPSNLDRRRWAMFPTARALNRSLEWECPSDRTQSKLEVSPDNSWPNTVYYHSFTHPDMGGKIQVVDRPKRSSVRRSAASLTTASFTSLIVSLASLLTLVR